MRDPLRDINPLDNMVEAIDYVLAFAESYDDSSFVSDKRSCIK